LSQTVGANITRFVHGPMGIHAQEDAAGAWTWMTPDGLGSVREVVNNSVGVQEVRLYELYGKPVTGAPYAYSATPYGFTGEPRDTGNELVYLRNRYFNPALGVFASLDPVEGVTVRPMSLNGYSWVEGNVPNALDPSGTQVDTCGDDLALAASRRCSLNVDRTAHVARGEAVGVDGNNFFVAAAAIALSIINNDIQSCNPQYPYRVLDGFSGTYIPG